MVLPLAVTGFIIAAGCWTLFAVAGFHLREALQLTGLQFGLLLAMPMAVGAVLAVPGGLIAQALGARRVMIWALAGLSACMLLLIAVTSYAGYLVAACGLGLTAAFYSAGLQFVMSHTPRHHVGLVLGVFSAGVIGAGLNYYVVPLLYQAFAWEAIPLAYLIVLLLVMVLMLLLTDNPDASAAPETETSPRQLLTRLRHWRIWRLCFYFGSVAGSFFAVALWLPDFLTSRFELPVDDVARLAQWFVIPGALAQVAGGGLADHFGVARVVSRALMVCLVALFVLSYPEMTLLVRGVEGIIQLEFAMPLPVERLFVVVLGATMGCAMGALLRMMVDQNPGATAFAAGMLLLSACSVAFLLPVVFALVNQLLGVPSAAFMILFAILAACLLLFTRVARSAERQSLLSPRA